jgi:hypothetical protein
MATSQKTIRSYEEYKKYIRDKKRANQAAKQVRVFLEVLQQYYKEEQIKRLPKRAANGQFAKS